MPLAVCGFGVKHARYGMIEHLLHVVNRKYAEDRIPASQCPHVNRFAAPRRVCLVDIDVRSGHLGLYQNKSTGRVMRNPLFSSCVIWVGSYDDDDDDLSCPAAAHALTQYRGHFSHFTFSHTAASMSRTGLSYCEHEEGVTFLLRR